MSPARPNALQRQYRAATNAGQHFTTVVSLTDFPLFAQVPTTDAQIPYWGFSYGINATFQFKIAENRPATAILETAIDREFGSKNGEGVDIFTPHGTKKQQLLLSIYYSIETAPYWMRSAGQNPPIREYQGGLVARMHARVSAPWTDEPKSVMEWHFYQTNKVAFNGNTNTLKHASGAQMSLSFEADDIPE